jgi:RNase P subunit RPR2
VTETLTLTCPNCGTEHRATVHPPDDALRVTVTDDAPDGVVEVTCARCGEEYAVGYRATA